MYYCGCVCITCLLLFMLCIYYAWGRSLHDVGAMPVFSASFICLTDDPRRESNSLIIVVCAHCMLRCCIV